MPSKRPPFKTTSKNRKLAPQKRSTKPSASTPIVTIEALSHEVRGIARHEGKTLFVDNALPGETVKVRYTANRARFDEATAIEIIEPAESRRTPPCPHFDLCGGCALQHMAAEAQISAKQQILLDQLQRFAKTSPEEVLPPLTGETLGYRRKARLGVRFVKPKGGGKPRLVLGFREKGSNDLTDIEQCAVLPANISALIPELKRTVAACSGKKQISHIEIAIGEGSSALIVRHLQPLSAEDREQWLTLARAQQLHLYLQADEQAHKVWPDDRAERLSYALPEFSVNLQFHPQDFIQVNFDINRKMVHRAIELLDLQPEDRVLDLFCGLGNFTLPIATRAREVVGVEGLLSLAQRGEENATANGLDNIRFQAADLTGDFSRSPWARGGFDKVLLDPPRTGALEVIRNIAQFNARRIVYVSCNPATLARDTAELLQRGYRLSKAGVMDMFPHTTHVESIALFERQ